MTSTGLAHILPTDGYAPKSRLARVGGADIRSDTIRVVVAAGQAVVRAGCRVFLERDERIAVIGEATSCEQAVGLARGMGPLVVLMDVGLPGVDCVEATRRLVYEPGVTVVLLTASESDDRILAALRAGAAGVLHRDAEPDELVGTVEVVARGGAVLPAYLTRRMIGPPASRPEPDCRRRHLRLVKVCRPWNSAI
jgi:DNA-binding NarL/FixJ family response regulator